MKPTITMILAALLLMGTPAFTQAFAEEVPAADPEISVDSSLKLRAETRPAAIKMEARAENRAEIMETREEMKETRDQFMMENKEDRVETNEEMKEKRETMREEADPEVREEMREEMREEHEENREEMKEKREEQREIVREKRGDVVARLSHNIIIRLESGVRKITQITERAQTAVDQKSAEGQDMALAQAELDNSAEFLASAELDIAEIKIMVATWADFDVTSDTFREELNNQKEELRKLMRSAHENLKSAGSSIRSAIKEIKEAAAEIEVNVEVETEVDTSVE